MGRGLLLNYQFYTYVASARGVCWWHTNSHLTPSPISAQLMRPQLIAGIVLIVAGAFVIFNGGSFTTRQNVLQVGDLKISAEEKQPIAPWIAGAAILGGIALIVTGSRRRG